MLLATFLNIFLFLAIFESIEDIFGRFPRILDIPATSVTSYVGGVVLSTSRV